MKAAVLFLAALASASPLATPQARGQDACDCSKQFHFTLFEYGTCKAGYEDISGLRDVVDCAQVGCSEDDFTAKCGADGVDAQPGALPSETPAEASATPKEQGNCDCSKSFSVNVFETHDEDACPAGYVDLNAHLRIPNCVQAGCSEDDFNTQCNANP